MIVATHNVRKISCAKTLTRLWATSKREICSPALASRRRFLHWTPPAQNRYPIRLHRSKFGRPMSALGQKRTSAWCGTCALLRCVIAHLVQRLRKRRRRWGWHGAMARIDSLVQVISGVVGQPHFAFIIFPDQRLSWQIDC